MSQASDTVARLPVRPDRVGVQPSGTYGAVTGSSLLVSVAATVAVAPAPRIPGGHQDRADFYGLLLAVAIIAAVVVIIRVVFRRPTKPPPDPRPPHARPPDGPPVSGPSDPGS